MNGRVYDVTPWLATHPGGPDIVLLYAGDDATDVFTAFHHTREYVSHPPRAPPRRLSFVLDDSAAFGCRRRRRRIVRGAVQTRNTLRGMRVIYSTQPTGHATSGTDAPREAAIVNGADWVPRRAGRAIMRRAAASRSSYHISSLGVGRTPVLSAFAPLSAPSSSVRKSTRSNAATRRCAYRVSMQTIRWNQGCPTPHPSIKPPFRVWLAANGMWTDCGDAGQCTRGAQSAISGPVPTPFSTLRPGRRTGSAAPCGRFMFMQDGGPY